MVPACKVTAKFLRTSPRLRQYLAGIFLIEIDVMLDGTFLGCRAAIPRMSRDGTGAIVNIASMAGVMGLAAVPGYSGAKGGIISLTRSVAVHCRENGYRIRVNSISPGSIRTPMIESAIANLPSDSPGLGDFGQPIDIAKMVLYLACEDGRHINGANIVIDHGESIA